MIWNMAYILFVPQCEPLLYPVEELGDLVEHLKHLGPHGVRVCTVEYNSLGPHVSEVDVESLK